MDMSILPTIGLLLFLAVFIGVFLWSFRKGSKLTYEEAGLKALEDGEVVNSKGELQ
ncbi:cytochrome C oxidase, Cbb3-type, CcoQ subunit [Bacteriovorax sp. DB6_IX]|nr:cytochrome C oxidase, Cbb3-type, CcoQ subunit [Bacteriovorax sp. DB6_IX]